MRCTTVLQYYSSRLLKYCNNTTLHSNIWLYGGKLITCYSIVHVLYYNETNILTNEDWCLWHDTWSMIHDKCDMWNVKWHVWYDTCTNDTNSCHTQSCVYKTAHGTWCSSALLDKQTMIGLKICKSKSSICSNIHKRLAHATHTCTWKPRHTQRESITNACMEHHGIDDGIKLRQCEHSISVNVSRALELHAMHESDWSRTRCLH